MRIMAIDYGTKRVGIALSDNLKIISKGFEEFTYKENDHESLINHLVDIVKQQNVDEIVIGLPYHMNGDESDKIVIIKEISSKLENLTNIKVRGIDERLTTVVANNFLLEADLSRNKRKKVIDKMSAVVILDNYMEAKKNGTIK